MEILIIGSGGREHALATAYAKSKKVKKIFVAPGNDFMPLGNRKIQTLPEIGVMDFKKIIAFAKKESITLVDVAQDDPIAHGLVDELTNEGIETFGPFKNAAEIEWNKKWARQFMEKYALPIPRFESFSDQKIAIDYVNKLKEQTLYIKASGLAAGKGVIRAETKEEAITAIKSMKQFDESGKTFLIEEAMLGEEFSLFAICDGETYQIIASAKDHKTIFEKDQGPNTGGMGCVVPTTAIDEKILKEIKTKILNPFMSGMRQEKRTYSGILYIGGMLTSQGVKIVEFNARWGDPEAEVILPGIKTDYVDIVTSIIKKKLNTIKVHLDKKIRVSIAGCARGYPNDYSAAAGKRIFGLDIAMKIPGITIYGAGIKQQGKNFVVNSGRIFHLVAEGIDVVEARKKAYKAMSLIYIEGANLHYRKDIGWRELERETS